MLSLNHVLISVYNNLSFYLFRYTAICHPLKVSLHFGKTGTILIILTIWILCLFPSALWSKYTEVNTDDLLNWKKLLAEDKIAYSFIQKGLTI